MERADGFGQNSPGDEFAEATRLQRCSSEDERQALFADLLMRDKERLQLMVQLRMDPRVRARESPSDIVQESFLRASERLQEYIEKPKLPFFLWLRKLTEQKLVDVHRKHLGPQRDARREASSPLLAAKLVTEATTPSERLIHDETTRRLQDALEQMDEIDREILALRHFEQLSNAEAARVLGIQPSAASKRHRRALGHLEGLLKDLGMEGNRDRGQ